MAVTQRYRSRLTTVLTLIGVAVGLGNVWRFPYMMGSYGGSAFLLIYLIFTLCFAIPALIAELSLGRHTRSSTVPAFTRAIRHPWGRRIGFLLLASVFIAGSYYAVVVGNVVFSAFFSVTKGFGQTSTHVYGTQLSNGWLQYGVAALVIIAACFVIDRGLRRGIEVISKFFVPLFLATIIYLIVFVLGLPGAADQLLAFLRPDFADLTSQNVFAALGQAFYSVGLGGTFIVAYGSYLGEKESIPRIALMTGAGDVSASLLVSLFLVPTILIFGLDMEAGPGLIFDTLPQLFQVMPSGRITGSLFLLVLSLVAFLSLVAAYEVVAGSVSAITRWPRRYI
ncbi:MAG: sodium-dependent transporter, partial [Saprospiraceae bacterium]|nr:sodium-dependent transporter [Saprospiraceae bacterium]